MIIDKNGKLFGKVSVIDLVIVIAVLALAIFAVIRFFGLDGVSTPEDQTIIIGFTQYDAPDYAANAVKIGDYCYNVSEKGPFGYVSDFSVRESRFNNIDADGNFVITQLDGFATIEIFTEAEGYISEKGGAVIGDLTFYLGKTIEIRCGNSAFYGRITSIDAKEN